MLSALGFLLAVAWVPGWTGGAIPTGWIVLSLILPFVLKPIPFRPSYWWGLAFLAYAGLSLLWTPYPLEGVQVLWQLAILALAFWFGAQEENLEPLFFGLGVGLLVTSLPIAIAQYYGWAGVGFVFRPAGLFFNPIVLASVVTLVIIGLLGYKRFYLASSLVPLLALSGSRVFIPAFGVVGLIWLSRKGQQTLSLCLGLAAILAVLMIDRPMLPRLEIWYLTLMSLKPFGEGVASFLWLTENGRLTSAHSDFLELAYLYGLALIPLVVALTPEETNAPEFYVFVAFLVLATYSSPLTSPVSGFLGLVCAGYLSLSRCDCIYCGPAFPKGVATPVGVYD